MASRRLSRLVAQLEAAGQLSPQLLPNYRPHTSVSILQRPYSSHIVKSPFKHVEIPDQLIPELVWETVDKFPDHPAMVYYT